MAQDAEGFMDEIEHVAGSAWRHPKGPNMAQNINETPAIEILGVTLTMKDDEDAAPVSVIFNRDLGDTWSIWVGSTYLAVRNPAQGAVITRLVELIEAQLRTIIFDVDGTERDHE